MSFMATGSREGELSDDEVLLDAELIGDPDSARELGPAKTAELLADEDIKGSRILIVRRNPGPRQDQVGGGALVEINCAFQSEEGMRFVSGRVTIQLVHPHGAVFLDVAPTEIRDPVKVTYTLEPGGKISLGLGRLSVEPSMTAKSQVEYNSFICRVRGSGVGSARAIWDFEEDAVLKQGIGPSQALAVTVPASQTVNAELLVKATIAKNGWLGAARDLVLGRTPEERMRKIILCKADEP
jgi:hypothetical protein